MKRTFQLKLLEGSEKTDIITSEDAALDNLRGNWTDQNFISLTVVCLYLILYKYIWKGCKQQVQVQVKFQNHLSVFLILLSERISAD